MSISLAELAARLEADVPARDSTPDAEQYQRCVKAAVGDLGRKAGRYKISTLSIVANTATYSLPADFLKVIRMESLVHPDNILHTAAGIVPLETGFKERYTVANGQITFYPTPGYTMDRYLHYQAGWALDATDVYTEMGEDEAETLLLEAGSQALLLQANYFAQQAWQYAIGDERVSKEKLAAELRAQGDALHGRYLARVERHNAAYGSRSEYSGTEYW
jgi:hypothetical protein